MRQLVLVLIIVKIAGAYTGGIDEHPMRFQQVKAPTKADLTRLTYTIAQRVGRYLERQGLVERDAGNIFLSQCRYVRPYGTVYSK